MRSTVNHLIQLQELTLIRDEQRSIRGAGADLGELNKSIDAMAGSLDPAVKVVRDRLYKKDHIVMAPMNAGSCSVCGMKLAISVVQAVKLCRSLVTCPSCARILYDPSGAKWVAERPKRSSGEHKVGVARFSAPELMVPELAGATPEAAIAELAGTLQAGKFVDDAAKLVQDAMARETTLPTGVGNGLAFPHVRGVEGGGLSLAFGVSRKGIKWGGADEKPVHFVFFSTIPTAVSMFYLRLLAGLAESYGKEPNRKAALEAKDAVSLWKALVKATRFTVK
ncbi:MAG: PTS sugar transporter subunit IIA [Kiritimatiellae bacterium]|nr:PTS sugar transporter subunit IIA [Kiritimatiellia bacterium]